MAAAQQSAAAAVGSGGLRVSLVTPRGAVESGEVDAVTARGVVGELGILPGHRPLLTALAAGVLVLGQGAEKRIYATGPGYLKVGADGSIEALVEQAIPLAKIDAQAAKAEVDAVNAELKAWSKGEDADWKTLQARLAWAQAQLDAVKRAGN
jgi:F-type H+-transporting ATPase subunit epsilon